ncbi:MAG TPA: hypothetical protein VGL44_17120 [Gaiellales bacterium]|jgi:hypothetical protein
MSTDPKHGERSHGEDYPGSTEGDSAEEQYDAPPAAPDAPKAPDPASKPKPGQ